MPIEMPGRRRPPLGAALAEMLESRLLLAAVAVPDPALLTDPTNPVLRLTTNVGTVDVELFPGAAPENVSFLMEATNAGLAENSLFFRSEAGVLEAGSRVLQDVTPLPRLRPGALTDLSPAPDLINPREPGLPRVPGTLSIVQDRFDLAAGGQATATSFSFNMAASPLTTPRGMLRVTSTVGRVIGDGSMEVLSMIGNLPIVTAPSELPEFRSTSVPSLTGAGFNGEDAVFLRDVEVIRAEGADDFFRHRTFYPEGFAGSTIHEFMPLYNPNEAAVDYQIIARFEAAGNDLVERRDLVIASGRIEPLSRDGVTIFNAGSPDEALVPQGVPYALELQSTRPIAATLSHYDFGAATGSAFTDNLDTLWTLPEVTRSTAGEIFDFLLWYNPTDDPTLVEAAFIDETGGEVLSITQTVGPLRRAGLSVNTLDGLPDGAYTVRITADAAIVAALSHYDQRSPVTAFTSPGQFGPGDTAGILPLASVPEDGGHTVTFANLNEAPAAVTLTLRFEEPGTPDLVLPDVIVQPGARERIDLGEAPGVTPGDNFSVLYESTLPVYAFSSHVEHGDEAANPFGDVFAESWHIAEGFMDPARAGVDLFETIAIAPADVDQGPLETAVIFRFTDGTELVIDTVVEDRVTVLRVHELQPVLAQGRNADRFFYAIEVIAEGPVIVQFWHFDLTLASETPAGGFGTIPQPLGLIG